MNIFSPFTVVEDNNNMLHLKMGKVVQGIMFFALRIFPLLLIMAAGGFVLFTYPEVELEIYGVVLITVVIASAFLFAFKYCTEVIITPYHIQTTQQVFFTKINNNFPHTEVEKLGYQVRYGKSSGLYYYVFLFGSKKKRLLFSLASGYQSEKIAPVVNEKIQAVSKLELKRV